MNANRGGFFAARTTATTEATRQRCTLSSGWAADQTVRLAEPGDEHPWTTPAAGVWEFRVNLVFALAGVLARE